MNTMKTILWGRSGRRASCVAMILGWGILEATSTSCANAEDTGAQTDASQSIPSGGGESDATADAADDADACAVDSAACRLPIPSCDEVEWCAADTTLAARIALSAVWGSGENDVWAAGSKGNVIHWDGRAWTATPTPTGQSLYAIWGTGPNDVWTVSTTDAIYRSTGFANGAAQWSLVTAIPRRAAGGHGPINGGGTIGQTLTAIWGTSPNDIWLAGQSIIGPASDWESSWRTVVGDDDAVSWSTAFNVTSVKPQGLWGSGPDDVWMVGANFAEHTDGTTADDGTLNWTAFDVPSASPLYAVWGSGPGDVWAVGGYGTIVHFTAALGQWRAVDSSTTADLRGLWGAGPNDIWAVGDRGTLLHWDGTAWRSATGAFSPADKPTLYGVWGSGSSDVWAVGSETILHYSGPKAVAGGSGR